MGYQVSGGLDVPVYYRCSQCKRINKFKHHVGTSYTGRNDGKAEAEEAFKVKLNLFRDKLWTDAKQRKYYSAQYNTKCLACGHQEAWSNLRFDKLDTISTIGGFVFVLFGLMELGAWFESGDASTYFLISITSLLALIVPRIIKPIIRRKREKEIEQLDYAYHPIICWREEDEEKIIQELTDRAREASIIE